MPKPFQENYSSILVNMTSSALLTHKMFILDTIGNAPPNCDIVVPLLLLSMKYTRIYVIVYQHEII